MDIRNFHEIYKKKKFIIKSFSASFLIQLLDLWGKNKYFNAEIMEVRINLNKKKTKVFKSILLETS